MKTITVNSEKYGLHEIFVDDQDFEYLNQFKWWLFKPRNIFYAARKLPMINCIPGKNILMHREILNLTDPKVMVDHKNHNGLDNQRSNIRVSSSTQNSVNINSRKNCSSKYLGVSYYKRSDKWRADIKINKKGNYIGLFETEKEAALAYNTKAMVHHGEFANLNIII